TVKLYWERRPDILTRGSGGGLDAMRDRLKTVEVDTGGHLMRAYALSYELSPTSGESLLASVQQFGDSATISPSGVVTGGSASSDPGPEPPTMFCYESDESLSTCGGKPRQTSTVHDVDLGAQPDGYAAPSSSLAANFDFAASNSTWTTGDFNGD